MVGGSGGAETGTQRASVSLPPVQVIVALLVIFASGQLQVALAGTAGLATT